MDQRTATLAQVLREVNILFENHPDINQISFILTNSETWSIALAKKQGKKLQVPQCYKLHVDLTTPDDIQLKKLIGSLKCIWNGQLFSSWMVVYTSIVISNSEWFLYRSFLNGTCSDLCKPLNTSVYYTSIVYLKFCYIGHSWMYIVWMVNLCKYGDV